MENSEAATATAEPGDQPMRASDPILTELPFDESLPPLPAVEVPLPTDSNMLRLLVNNKRVEQLWAFSERQQAAVVSSINNVKLAEDLLKKVESARSQILSGRAQYEEADRLLKEVEYRIALAKRVSVDTRTVGVRLLIYELVWLLLLSASFIVVNLTPALSNVYLVPPLDHVSVIQFVNSLIWGSMGGLVGALYALWKHTSDQQDFDGQHAVWYITNPILGLALGAFIFLIIQAGFLSLTAGGSNGDAIRSASVIYVVAWIAGFKQNVVYELVRRILDVFRVNSSESDQPGETPLTGSQS